MPCETGSHRRTARGLDPVLGLEPCRELQRRGVELLLAQPVALFHLREDRRLDRVQAELAQLVLERARGRRIPVRAESLVDRHQPPANPLAPADHDHRPAMGSAGDQPLADADQLRAPAGVDAPGARAVLTGDLTHPRVDAQPAERGGEQFGHLPEALCRAGRRAGVGDRPRAGQRSLVKDGGTATGEAHHGLEPALRAAAHGGGEARGRPILARESEDRPGAVEPKDRRKLARGDPDQDGARNSRAEGGTAGKALAGDA